MSFTNIKGHDNIKFFFKRALEKEAVSHSYIFFGPDGVGKMLFAKTLSKALNCLDRRDDACDKCASCLKIENGKHPDVAIVEVAEKKDSIGIEQIRMVRERISLKPYEGRTKVFIIKDSHLMTEEAANCLLETLEEPAVNSVLILITSRVEVLLETVRSRCKQIKFEPLDLKIKVELVRQRGFSEDEAVFLSRLENSGVCVPKLENRHFFEFKNRILNELSSKLSLLDEASFIFGESKEKMKFMLSVLESWFRDIFVFKAGGPSALVINSDRLKDIKVLSDEFSFEDLEDILKEVKDAQFSIERNVGPKIAFNNLKLKLKR